MADTGSSVAQLRLLSDLKDITQTPPNGCSASPISDSSLFVWGATIFGPADTPWYVMAVVVDDGGCVAAIVC